MSIGIDGRCINPSTHIRGGGYVEVECYCEAHALEAAKKYGDAELPRLLDPNHGCLDTTVGLMRNRRRCQWEDPSRAHQAAAELAAAVDAVRREAAALFHQLDAENTALRKRVAELAAPSASVDAVRRENAALRERVAELEATTVELGLRAGGAGGGAASLGEEVIRLRKRVAELEAGGGEEVVVRLLKRVADLERFNGSVRIIGTITVLEQQVEDGFAVTVHSAELPFVIEDVSNALFRSSALVWFGRQLREVGEQARGAPPQSLLQNQVLKEAQEAVMDDKFKAEVAEVSAQMAELEAKWAACTEDHKGRSTDRPCPACGFGG